MRKLVTLRYKKWANSHTREKTVLYMWMYILITTNIYIFTTTFTKNNFWKIKIKRFKLDFHDLSAESGNKVVIEKLSHRIKSLNLFSVFIILKNILKSRHITNYVRPIILKNHFLWSWNNIRVYTEVIPMAASQHS